MFIKINCKQHLEAKMFFEFSNNCRICKPEDDVMFYSFSSSIYILLHYIVQPAVLSILWCCKAAKISCYCNFLFLKSHSIDTGYLNRVWCYVWPVFWTTFFSSSVIYSPEMFAKSVSAQQRVVGQVQSLFVITFLHGNNSVSKKISRFSIQLKCNEQIKM